MKDKIEISTDKDRLDIEMIHEFISNQSYWGKGRTLEEVQRTIENSINFGVYEHNKQIGFCRVVTDTVTFAYVMDFFVIEEFQQRGIGEMLAQEMLSHSELTSVRWLLATNDANGFYAKFGFRQIEDTARFMEKLPDSGS